MRKVIATASKRYFNIMEPQLNVGVSPTFVGKCQCMYRNDRKCLKTVQTNSLLVNENINASECTTQNIFKLTFAFAFDNISSSSHFGTYRETFQALWTSTTSCSHQKPCYQQKLRDCLHFDDPGSWFTLAGLLKPGNLFDENCDGDQYFSIPVFQYLWWSW